LIEYESAHGHQLPGTHLMVDAGGNHGTYALYSAALNQSVLVFEILSDYWIIIQESIRINPKFNERMILYPFGVSDEYQEWKILSQAETSRLDFMKSKISKTHDEKSWNNLTIAHAYPLDDFIFQKVSVMKIDVEGFEIRALKGAIEIIRHWGVGAILIEIVPKRWSWNNITIEEGISVLEQVTSIGNYVSYVIARNDESCPVSQISKLNGIIETKTLSMINMQNGIYEVAPQIFRLTEWSTIMMHMKGNDWSCNFWLESTLK
jgi:FkbM family methyltransferase